MKFITEADLRCLFKKEPFTTYHLLPNFRLTPGARQFLSDNRISVTDEKTPLVDVPTKKETPQESQVQADHWRLTAYQRRIKSIEALFLTVAQEFLNIDLLLAQKLIRLKNIIASIKNPLGVLPIDILHEFQSCTGITQETVTQPLSDCVVVNEFHIYLPKGRAILQLNNLKCAVEELEPLVTELNESFGEDTLQYQEALNRVNLVINSLSQLICVAIGGTECLRKN